LLSLNKINIVEADRYKYDTAYGEGVLTYLALLLSSSFNFLESYGR